MNEGVLPLAIGGWPDFAPVLIVALPFVSVLAILAANGRSRLQYKLGLATGLTIGGLLAFTGAAIIDTGSVPSVGLHPFLPGIAFELRVDPFGVLLGGAVAASVLVLLPTVTTGHLSVNPTTLHSGLLGAMGAGLGILFAGNLVVMFVFFQILTVSLFVLLRVSAATDARAIGYRFLGYSFTGDLMLLGGLRVLYWQTGSVTFVAGGMPGLRESAMTEPWLAQLAFALLLGGLAIRTAVLPAHRWFLDAASTPPGVFALGFATIAVTSGAAGIGRVLMDAFGPTLVSGLDLGWPLVGVLIIALALGNLRAIGSTRQIDRISFLTICGTIHGVLGLVGFSGAAIAGGAGYLAVHTLGIAAIAVGWISISYADSWGTIPADNPSVFSAWWPSAIAFTFGAATVLGVPALAGFPTVIPLLVGTAGAMQGLVAFALAVSLVIHLAVLIAIARDTDGLVFPTPSPGSPPTVPTVDGQSISTNSSGRRVPDRRLDSQWVVPRWPAVFIAALLLFIGIAPGTSGLLPLVRSLEGLVIWAVVG